ncbi:MAG: plasmid pRiA4b ORF-3 family protein [Deltaproteobacteria bacterium]|jgi:hypothetical protein|nr:plasmid pRiA4b ORF-3 family protein [Deltaproteobacteria bacterium]
MSKIPIYQFRAELTGSKPKVWRFFEVLDNIKLSTFCYTLMSMFEMRGIHLFSLEYLGKNNLREDSMLFEFIYDTFGLDSYSRRQILNPNKFTLKQITTETGAAFRLIYDFGDDWRVRAKLIKTYIDPNAKSGSFPRVLRGRGSGIVENSGGVHRLQYLAQISEENDDSQDLDLEDQLSLSALNNGSFDRDWINRNLKRDIADLTKKYKGCPDFMG